MVSIRQKPRAEPTAPANRPMRDWVARRVRPSIAKARAYSSRALTVPLTRPSSTCCRLRTTRTLAYRTAAMTAPRERKVAKELRFTKVLVAEPR
ncbi:hypothetical protein D3C87_1938390 [compost metagenome]